MRFQTREELSAHMRRIRKKEAVRYLKSRQYRKGLYARFLKSSRGRGRAERQVSVRDDLRIKMTLSEFLTEAWQLANEKAQELGWID